MPRKPLPENMLPLASPKLVKEWHSTKNGSLVPDQISLGSTKKIWWKCPKGDDHEWEASPNSRGKGSGCPICSGRKVMKSNCLATTHPQIAKEWHPSKNEDKRPEQFTAGTLTKIWWQCPKGEDHEWQAQINNRKNGNGCPFCAGNKASITNSLKTTHPEISSEWHPTKNHNLTQDDVTIGMTQKVWWKCPKGDDHEWQAGLNLRGRGFGCPICSGRKVVTSNCLATIEPDLCEEWHQMKNGVLSPYDVTKGSPKKIWWQCPKGIDHVYQSTISDRRRGLGCPICSGRVVVQSNSLSTVRSDIAKQWHLEKNGKFTADMVTTGSPKKAWWKCPNGDDHVWKTSVNARTNGTGCPYCANKKLSKSNNLLGVYPALANEIDQSKNKINPSKIIISSSEKLWWKCDQGDDHVWKASINSRVNGSGCHVCWGRKVVKSNSLQHKYPELLDEWNYKKNNDNPIEVYHGSSKKYWWKCLKGDDHEWQASVSKRMSGRGCPVCTGHKVVKSNCLETLRPDLVSQWYFKNNGVISPSQFTLGSSKKIWWKCPKGDDHIWEAPISSRVNGSGCPICSGYKVVKSNSLSTTHPKLSKQWHSELNGQLTEHDVMAGSTKKIWWKCDKGVDHLWKTSVRKRAIGRGCPYCTLTPQSKQELTITFELSKFFNEINPKGLKTRIKGKLHSIDIFIPKINLGVEFDGSYWHKGKRELDKMKTLKFEAAGFNIVRIREEPLKRIFDTDIISKQPYNGKEITNDLLKFIMSTYKLDKRTITMFEKYLLKDELQNQKALVNYIEQILTAKALEKKKRTTTKPKLH